LECLLCGDKFAVDKGLPYCDSCWSTLENGGVPPMDFRKYFSGSLEEKLSDVESLIDNLPDHYFLWYLKGHM
jgi:hypothetical protein